MSALEKININPKELYEGCVFAAIIHAVTVGEFPELNYEHSWDGLNYSMNNSQGCRATITFHPQYIIAVFQDISKWNPHMTAYDYLTDMPDDILKIAESEALQYVLENINGEIRPAITAAFWGSWSELFSSQTWDEILENGGFILKEQLSDHSEAFALWDDYYGLNNEQMNLIESLFERKMKNDEKEIYLQPEEMDYLYGDVGECIESLAELKIYPYTEKDSDALS